MFGRDPGLMPTFSPAPLGIMQRKCACAGTCGGCGGASEYELQRFATDRGDGGVHGVPAVVGEVLRGGGKPLDAGLRRTMESRFGQDFSQVQVHDGPRAAESARAVRAMAYTVGRDVVFGEGQYRPGDRSGQRLIAHELAHVVQQRQGGAGGRGVQPRAIGGGAHDALEHEADRAADAVLAGGARPSLRSSRGGALQRQPAPNAQPAGDEHSAEKAPEEEKKSPLVHEYTGKHGYGRFRAELDPAAAVLKVTMRVKFDFDTYASTWLGHQEKRQKFVDDFISKNQAAWSEKYVLVPDGDSKEYKSPVRVVIRILPVSSNEHYTVFARYSEFPMSQKEPERAGTNTAHISSDALQGSLRSGKDFDHARYSTPALHEFGHMLGLAHIGADKTPICAEPGAPGAKGNTGPCYGSTEAELNDIMGRGMFVSPRDYLPFVESMNVIAPKAKWKVADPQSGGLPWWAYVLIGAALIGGGIALGSALHGSAASAK